MTPEAQALEADERPFRVAVVVEMKAANQEDVQALADQVRGVLDGQPVIVYAAVQKSMRAVLGALRETRDDHGLAPVTGDS